jgi:hypothetical protein
LQSRIFYLFPLLSHSSQIFRPSDCPLFDCSNNIWLEVYVTKPSCSNFLHSPVISSHLGPNKILSFLFSKKLNVRNQVQDLQTATGKLMFLHRPVPVSMFGDKNGNILHFCKEDSRKKIRI